VQSKSGLPLIQSLAFGAFSRVQGATASVADGVRGFWAHYLALGKVSRENDALHRQVAELEGRVQAQQALINRTHALEGALGLHESLTVPTLTARVIAGSASPDTLTVTIDRGALDGVEPDMAVINDRGVVGRIINRPAAHAAQVQLLVGNLAGAGAKLERTPSVGGFAAGTGNRRIRLDLVPSAAW